MVQIKYRKLSVDLRWAVKKRYLKAYIKNYVSLSFTLDLHSRGHAVVVQALTHDCVLLSVYQKAL
jgi:hypothetical protein